MITVNAMGDACPIPVVKTKNAIASLKGADVVETLVDNEIAVENLKKMADQKGYKSTSEKLEEGKYRVCIIVENVVDNVEKKDGDGGKFCDCTPEKESNKVVVIRSSVMGEGDPELGKVLLKGFIYAISQQKDLPKTMLFYNGGAFITCEGSQSLEDLKALVAKFKMAVKAQTGKDFPTSAYEQLWGAICAVFDSWMNERFRIS